MTTFAGQQRALNAKRTNQDQRHIVCPSRGWRIQRFRCYASSKEYEEVQRSGQLPQRSRDVLNKGIAAFYDSSTALWEDMWGDHLHHGYYDVSDDDQGQEQQTRKKSNMQAQVDMIDNVLSWAGVESVKSMVDVGCGLGGSSRHIAKKYGCTAQGITLSPYQARRGNEISKSQGLGSEVELRVADALDQPFEDNTFDLVWSLESGEHMPNKKRFVDELIRVAAPGGRVIIVTWCHRVLDPGEETLTAEETTLLDQICDAYYLPQWCSVDDYVSLFDTQGMENIRIADWSKEVAPFWGQVIKSALSIQGMVGLLKSGWKTLRGAFVMPLMAKGLQTGLVRFVLITGTKPK